MLSRSPLLAAWLACCGLPALAHGQWNRAQGHLEKLMSVSRDFTGERDASRLESLGKEMIDLAASLSSSLRDVGESLARASGPSDGERSAISRAAQGMVKAADEIRSFVDRGVTWAKNETEKQKDSRYWRGELDQRCTQARLAANNLGEHWKSLNTRIDETKRWLRETYNAALTLRDRAADPASALQRLEEERLARLTAIKDRKQRAFGEWFQACTRLSEANYAENQAQKRWEDGMKSKELTTDQLESLHRNWEAAQAVKKTAASNLAETSNADKRLGDEITSFIDDYAKVFNDIQTFIKDATPQSINRRCAEVEQWLKLLDTDLKR